MSMIIEKKRVQIIIIKSPKAIITNYEMLLGVHEDVL